MRKRRSNSVQRGTKRAPRGSPQSSQQSSQQTRGRERQRQRRRRGGLRACGGKLRPDQHDMFLQALLGPGFEISKEDAEAWLRANAEHARAKLAETQRSLQTSGRGSLILARLAVGEALQNLWRSRTTEEQDCAVVRVVEAAGGGELGSGIGSAEASDQSDLLDPDASQETVVAEQGEWVVEKGWGAASGGLAPLGRRAMEDLIERVMDRGVSREEAQAAVRASDCSAQLGKRLRASYVRAIEDLADYVCLLDPSLDPSPDPSPEPSLEPSLETWQ